MLKPKQQHSNLGLAVVQELSATAKASLQTGIQRFSAQTAYSSQVQHDCLAIEEPLQLSLQWFCQRTNQYQLRPLSLTMRTPGNDVALVLGFLQSQNIIESLNDIDDIRFAQGATAEQVEDYNHLEIQLNRQRQFDWAALERNFASYSSCGLCGASSVKALALNQQPELNMQEEWLAASLIYQLPSLLQEHQPLFKQSGAVHGVGVWADGKFLSVAEDIGRHNALDKALGQLLLESQQAVRSVLVLSGRVSFELMQKALIANIPVVVAVGAPSSLALSVAKQFNITLIGFTKDSQFNVYHAPWRISKEGGSQYES
ncbi:formate dehydrogenase accessory sulfurtransferase FdhD [Agarivorans albus]|uniref:Sulfur carrier protein FdhD n=1 Tax=Agarivorans albus MKT 106 TaxID=1331007 RepID=R9PRA0_AGAAL|nr:formate dehydrogenase accessory sulfurtransferase FdhD [Agarivorans albus]GAD00656.1 formate dehydrogenase chain D [Agarivorans albus MKT 106]